VIEAVVLAAADTTPSGEDVVPRLIETGAVLLGFLILWLVLRRLAARVVRRMSVQALEQGESSGPERVQRIETLWSVLRSMIVVALLVAFTLILLDTWGVAITPLLAVGSVVGIAIGFGAQDFIKDMIAGFLVVAENQYALGDVVSVAGVSGKVEAIRLRTTVLRDLDGYVHHVPNGAIKVASNYTHEFAQVVIDLDIGYEEDVDRALEVLKDEMDTFTEDPEWSYAFRGAPEILGVEALADWSVKVRALLRVDPDARWSAKRELLRRIKKRFDAEGITFPFPHVTIVTADGEDG